MKYGTAQMHQSQEISFQDWKCQALPSKPHHEPFPFKPKHQTGKSEENFWIKLPDTHMLSLCTLKQLPASRRHRQAQTCPRQVTTASRLFGIFQLILWVKLACTALQMEKNLHFHLVKKYRGFEICSCGRKKGAFLKAFITRCEIDPPKLVAAS